MRKWFGFASLIGCLLIAAPVIGMEAESSRPSVPKELSDAWERFQRSLQEWGERVWERFDRRGSRENQPAISQMLSYKDKLGLSEDQVRKLEQLRDGFQRQSIRNDADLRIVELDIEQLLESDPVDMDKLEAKMRESEKLRTDLRLARIRAIEQARGLLNLEQKKKFQDLGTPPLAPRFGQNPPARERDQLSR